MPTPISTAKQCLNPEASHALDEAMSVARRRGHAQTTSLHAIFAFLSLSPSQLKEACFRARNAALNPRVQLKALDFCLSVSLDRLPTSQSRYDEPPISNSLMAAIKRSQANQRRHPDSFITLKNLNFQLGQGQLGQSSSIKVELQHLIVSILDDPIVSRVFNDAGFRSFDVKLAILRPFQSFFRYPQRVRGHQGWFLCNLDGQLDPDYRPFRFPFSGYWGNFDGVEDYGRIGEILVRKKGRNPLLVGVCANDVLKGFLEVLEKKKENVLPLEIHGIHVVSIERDVFKFVSENWSEEAIHLRFREVGLMVDHSLGPGLMVSFGNLRCFLDGGNGFRMDVVNRITTKLTKLLEVHGGRVWLIGSTANDQTYMEFISKFPSIDKYWDLQLLPITSLKPSMGDSCFKSSLMGSFVPFGGLFSSPPDLKVQLSSSYEYGTHRNQGNEKFEQGVATFSKSGFMASVADHHHHQIDLSPRLQMAELGENNTLDDLKYRLKAAKCIQVRQGQVYSGNGTVSQHLHHHNQSLRRQEIGRECSQLPSWVSSCNQRDSGKINSCLSLDIQRHFTSQSNEPLLLRSLKNENFLAELSETPSKTEHPLLGDEDGQRTPSSGDSMAVDLGLQLFARRCKQQKEVNGDVHNTSHVVKSSNLACFTFSSESNATNFKTLFEALYGRVGRQYDAVRLISQIVAHSWTTNGSSQRSGHRRDIWLNFIGPDIFGKRKTALALAEILYGSKNNFIHVDLCSEDGVMNGSDRRFRGKTVVDHLAEELRMTPPGIVFLENVDLADSLTQHSLLQASRSGRFSDSHGREVVVTNRVFVFTSRHAEGDSSLSSKEKPSNFPEERIARAFGWPLEIRVKGLGDYPANRNLADQIFFSKRKLSGTKETSEQHVSMDPIKRPHRGSSMPLDRGYLKGLPICRAAPALDLNLPAETSEAYGGYDGERSESWLDGFSDQLDTTFTKVLFDPFDYDALATEILKLVHESFYKVVGSVCVLEIESRVMDQILAAVCLSESDKKEVKDWIDQVLSKGFDEVHKRYQLKACSVVMITTSGSMSMEEQLPEACLPSKIIST